MLDEMKSYSLFSFFKKKAEANLEDKLQHSFDSRRSSAWSYSYDLNITKRYEEAMRMATKSEDSETDVEDKYSSGLILPKDLDDEYIFQSHSKIHEPTMIEHVISPASEVPNNINQKTGEGYIPDSPQNLWPPGKVSVDGSLSDVKRLRLSEIQNQRSWLGRITRPFPKDNNDDMNDKKKQKQWNKYKIQAVLIEYLEQFIEKTALPAIQKYEQLQKKYCNEKKEWTEKVEFLERQNSVLISELQNANRFSGDAEEELNNFKRFHSPNQISMKGNLWYDPGCKEIRPKTDFNLDALPLSDVKPCLSFEPEFTGKKGEFIDFNQGYCRQVNGFELQRTDALNKSQICYEDFPNMKIKLDEADKQNLERKSRQEALQSRNIFRKSKNNIDPEGSENLKVDHKPFWSSCVNARQEHHIATTSREGNHSFSKLHQLNPTKGTFVVEASRDHGGCACGWSTVQEGGKAFVPCVIEESTGTKLSSVTQDLRRMKEKTLPKTIFIDLQVLAVSDSWYFENKDGEAGALNNRFLKVDKKRRFANSQKMCRVNTPKSLDSRNRYRMTKRRLNKSISGSLIRSKWL